MSSRIYIACMVTLILPAMVAQAAESQQLESALSAYLRALASSSWGSYWEHDLQFNSVLASRYEAAPRNQWPQILAQLQEETRGVIAQSRSQQLRDASGIPPFVRSGATWRVDDLRPVNQNRGHWRCWLTLSYANAGQRPLWSVNLLTNSYLSECQIVMPLFLDGASVLVDGAAARLLDNSVKVTDVSTVVEISDTGASTLAESTYRDRALGATIALQPSWSDCPDWLRDRDMLRSWGFVVVREGSEVRIDAPREWQPLAIAGADVRRNGARETKRFRVASAAPDARAVAVRRPKLGEIEVDVVAIYKLDTGLWDFILAYANREPAIRTPECDSPAAYLVNPEFVAHGDEVAVVRETAAELLSASDIVETILLHWNPSSRQWIASAAAASRSRFEGTIPATTRHPQNADPHPSAESACDDLLYFRQSIEESQFLRAARQRCGDYGQYNYRGTLDSRGLTPKASSYIFAVAIVDATEGDRWQSAPYCLLHYVLAGRTQDEIDAIRAYHRNASWGGKDLMAEIREYLEAGYIRKPELVRFLRCVLETWD